MRLLLTYTSPYARKVRVTAAEAGVSNQIEWIEINPLEDPPELLSASAIGKVPVLIADDGDSIVDSRIICEFLMSVSAAETAAAQSRTWQDKVRVAVADGLMDSAVALVMESRRSTDERSPNWIRRWSERVLRVVESIDAGDFQGVTLGDIAVASALSYLNFRLPDIGWRGRAPTLASWHDRIEERSSFRDAPYGRPS